MWIQTSAVAKPKASEQSPLWHGRGSTTCHHGSNVHVIATRPSSSKCHTCSCRNLAGTHDSCMPWDTMGMANIIFVWMLPTSQMATQMPTQSDNQVMHDWLWCFSRGGSLKKAINHWKETGFNTELTHWRRSNDFWPGSMRRGK